MRYSIASTILMVIWHVTYADTSLLVFGASKHNGCDQTKYKCDFEQFNPGLGIEWSPSEHWWGRAFLRGGIYSDSERKAAYFTTAGARKDFKLGDKLKLGAGLMAGYLNGSNHNGLVVLPFISLAYDKVALEVGYGDNKQGNHEHQARARSVTTFSGRIDFY